MGFEPSTVALAAAFSTGAAAAARAQRTAGPRRLYEQLRASRDCQRRARSRSKHPLLSVGVGSQDGRIWRSVSYRAGGPDSGGEWRAEQQPRVQHRLVAHRDPEPGVGVRRTLQLHSGADAGPAAAVPAAPVSAADACTNGTAFVSGRHPLCQRTPDRGGRGSGRDDGWA